MSDLDALLAGIVHQPDDDFRWLIVADWLEENGQYDRAELLRLHREMLRTCVVPDLHPERAEWQARMMELLLAGVQPCVPRQTIQLPGGVALPMVFVPPGSFRMGSNNGDDDDDDNEKPVHEVRLTKGFWIGVAPVTQAQWKAVMGNNPSAFKGANRPVENVSWDDAQEFIGKLSQLTGEKFCLPTEAQWEYACRAGSTTDYWSGDGEAALKAVGWFDENSGDKTHPVGKLAANAWGIHDCHGNVWEWCADWYDSSYDAQSPQDDPQGPASGSRRVYRGGCWSSTADDCRSAYRNWITPDCRGSDLGFRVSAGPSGLK